MKTKTFLLMAAIILLACSCGSSRRAASGSVQQNPVSDQISVKVWPERNGGVPDKLEMTITNNSDSSVQYGADFTVERMGSQGWVEVKYSEPIAFIDLLYSLPAGEIDKHSVDLFPRLADFPAGEYRIAKHISNQSGSEIYYAYFEIIEPR